MRFVITQRCAFSLRGARQMSFIKTYDMLVIGNGEAGKYLGWTVAGEGHHTAVVERKPVGGPVRISLACRVRT